MLIFWLLVECLHSILQRITEQQADDVSWCVIKFCRKWSNHCKTDLLIESIIERYHNERVFWDVNKYTNFVNLEVKAAAWQRISFHIQLSNIVCRQRLFPRPLVLCPVAETKCCYRLMLRWEQTTATEWRDVSLNRQWRRRDSLWRSRRQRRTASSAANVTGTGCHRNDRDNALFAPPANTRHGAAAVVIRRRLRWKDSRVHDGTSRSVTIPNGRFHQKMIRTSFGARQGHVPGIRTAYVC